MQTVDEGTRIAHKFADLAKLRLDQERAVSHAQSELAKTRTEMDRMRLELGGLVGRNIPKKLIPVPSGIHVLVEYLSEDSTGIHVFDTEGEEIRT